MRKFCPPRFVWLLMAAVLLALPARATPVPFGSNYYDYIPALNISWADARTAAAGMLFGGVAGHLATVTSQAENGFLLGIADAFQSFAGAWLGGDVTGGNGFWREGPENGQQFSIGHNPCCGSYSNWGGIEPNNSPSAAYMNIGTHPQIAAGTWADSENGVSHPENDRDPIKGYFVEFESPSVPEPFGLSLLAFAALGLALGARRRR